MIKWPKIKFSLFLSCFFLFGCSPNLLFYSNYEPFRGLPYHAPTTKTPPFGVNLISAIELKSRLSSDENLILIDVYGAIFREESLDFDGEWLLSSPRKTLPKSVWLPNVGKQSLKSIIEQYYRLQLIKLTEGDKTKGLVIYCIEDCWMSWNASKRAHEWGYENVNWFREGVDGWIDNGWGLEDRYPENLPINN